MPPRHRAPAFLPKPPREPTPSRYGLLMGVRRVVIASLTAITLTACGTPPTPESPPPAASTPASAPTTTTTPEIVLPPRPRDIPIDDVDPCTLLTESQRTDLGLNDRPYSSRRDDPLLGPIRRCGFSDTAPNAISVGISLTESNGIELFLNSNLAAETTIISLAGFPGILIRPTVLPDFCSVEIDVGHQRLVDVQYGVGLSGQPIDQGDLCIGAERVAQAAMYSLLE